MPLIAAAAAIAVTALFIAGTWLAPRRAARRHHARLRTLSATELAREARRAADAAGIRKQFPRAALFDETLPCTSESLAEALDQLYADLSAADQRNHETGPGSSVYSFYDFGLASIREVLDVPRSHPTQQPAANAHANAATTRRH